MSCWSPIQLSYSFYHVRKVDALVERAFFALLLVLKQSWHTIVQKWFLRQKFTLLIRFWVCTTYMLNASPKLSKFVLKSLKKRVVNASPMGFWWSLEQARAKWAWFMLELRHTYEHVYCWQVVCTVCPFVFRSIFHQNHDIYNPESNLLYFNRRFNMVGIQAAPDFIPPPPPQIFAMDLSS